MIWHDFQRPGSVEIDEESRTPTHARFLAQPFERGWGTTVGNALRRALLSSLSGAAVTAIKIEGVDHEFSVVPGVVEDVTDIILNLKQVAWRLHGTEPVFLTLDARGPGSVTAGQFTTGHQIEVVDPDTHIATLSADGELRMTVRVAPGRGYVAAEDNQTEDLDLGFIPVDSAHSPVTKVNFRVEAARLGRVTTYERLVLEVWTDGTITPELAVAHAARMMTGHMDLYTALEGAPADVQPVAEEPGEAEEPGVLDQPIETLELSIRSLNCLKNAEIKTIRDLVTKQEKEMLEIRNFGDKSLREVKDKLEALGLGFGMQLDLG